MTDQLIPFVPEALVTELRALIESTRGRVAQSVNSELIWLHWQMGARAPDLTPQPTTSRGRSALAGLADRPSSISGWWAGGTGGRGCLPSPTVPLYTDRYSPNQEGKMVSRRTVGGPRATFSCRRRWDR
jgi:hypothetical protein